MPHASHRTTPSSADVSVARALVLALVWRDLTQMTVGWPGVDWQPLTCRQLQLRP